MLSILQAIWQADGAFPSGSFAFSYGIEGVVALRPELDQAGLAGRLVIRAGRRPASGQGQREHRQTCGYGEKLMTIFFHKIYWKVSGLI